MTWSNQIISYLLSPLFILIIPHSLLAHTGIGSGGGDVAMAFLEATSDNLERTVSSLRIQPDAPSFGFFQQHVLSAEQKTFCFSFFQSISAEFYEMLFQDTLRLEITEKPLDITGPDNRPVAAKTQLGPNGPITFNVQRITPMRPAELFALFAHELGHKVRFPHIVGSENRLFIHDDDRIGPFDTGRSLLDAFGVALAQHARKIGYIRENFSIIDRYYCRIESLPLDPLNSQPFIGGMDIRIPLDAPDSAVYFTRFESGIGPGRSMQLATLMPDGACLSMHILIHEEADCSKEKPLSPSQRFTKIDLYRTKGTGPSELVATKTNTGWVPMCESSPTAQQRDIDIDFANQRFVCHYRNTNAISTWSRNESVGKLSSLAECQN